MNEEDAAKGQKNRRVFFVILTLFVLAWIGTTIFGFIIVGNVRETADRSDRDMRALAWASIVYACAHEGRFPANEEELLSVAPLPESIACTPRVAGAWPTERSEVFGAEDAPDLASSFRRLMVHFSSDGTLAPAVDNNGLPTRLGTQEEVRGWLISFDEEKEAAQP